MKESLIEFLKNAKSWEKMETDIKGVFIVKIPGTKSSGIKDRLMIEINPVDASGKPKKFKGLFIPDNESYLAYLEALSDDRIPKILKIIEEINPKKEEKQIRKLKIE